MLLRLPGDLLQNELVDMIVALIQSLFQYHGKIIIGGLLIIQGLVVSLHGRIEGYMS